MAGKCTHRAAYDKWLRALMGARMAAGRCHNGPRTGMDTRMHTPQAAIFDKSARQHAFLEFRLSPTGTESAGRVIRTACNSAPPAVAVVVAFGPTLLRRLAMHVPLPAFGLPDAMPGTQSDLFVWLQAAHRSDIFDAARQMIAALSGEFELVLEQPAFVYHDSRDLTGFVDGIGNPEGDAARQAACVPSGSPGAGGSFVMGQRWRHRLDAFAALPVADQERVIGRTKQDAVEFDAERMPPDAHVARTDISRDGVAQKIWRRSVPWGDSRTHGLYFLAFSCDVQRFDTLLRSMTGQSTDGIRDRLLDYSVPETGSYWYAPPSQWLAGA